MDDLEGVLARRVLADRDAAAVVLDTVTMPSVAIVTWIVVAWPAIASSIELSTTSQTR